MNTRTTPLSQALATPGGRNRATPLSAFKEARRWWLKGNRMNLSALAEELGVSRVTLMRWVGNKELLLGEILWSLYKDIFDRGLERARENGRKGMQAIDYLTRMYHETITELMSSEPLQRFLNQDPRFAMQVLTSNVSPLPSRMIEAWRTLFEEEIAAGNISPQMDADSLAYFVVRLGEGALYSDLICGRQPAQEPADLAFRLLVSGRT